LPTLYKARGVPVKQPVCAICVDRTRGRTQRVQLPYGVGVWLCAGHADEGFLTRRNGRDFALTLMRVWQACGCFTVARKKALDAHQAALVAPRRARPRPGSYAWPSVRQAAERLFAGGVALPAVTRRVRGAEFGNAGPPSARTVARWHADRRWLVTGAAATTAKPP
jgi:hypothetical protein